MYVTHTREVKETTARIYIEQEYDFIKKPSEDFFCPVTKDLLLEPYQASCCGHHFSAEAVTRIQGEGGACPMCKKEKFVTSHDIYFRRQTHGLRVFCDHKERGCGWKGELSALNHHIQTCSWKTSSIVKDLRECLQ